MYTIYGNLSEIQLKISHNHFQLNHRLGKYLCYRENGKISNLSIKIDAAQLSPLPFDRYRVILEIDNKPHLLAPFFEYFNRSNRQYSLALLLTPTENQWLASEIGIFLDRSLRREKIYDAAIDSFVADAEAAEVEALSIDIPHYRKPAIVEEIK
jgi:hypothetical protein